MEETFDKTVDISFHGIDYIIRIVSNLDGLSIQLEQKDTGEIWKNSFLASYIEEITQKTGNFKKFPVFLKMLVTSFAKNSDSVFLDILTYQDLEMLKSRRTPNSQGNDPHNTSTRDNMAKGRNNKRYMILSYVVEFDKVHYPLPLNFEENPDPETMKATIKRMRGELEEVKTSKTHMNNSYQSSGNSFYTQQDVVKDAILNQVKNENDMLRNKIKRLEDAMNQKKGAVEIDMIVKNKFELENELEALKSNNAKEVARLKLLLDESEKMLQEKKHEIHKLKCDFANIAENEDASKRFKQEIIRMSEQTENEIANAKKTLSKQQKDIDRLEQELEAANALNKKQNIRIKQLEMDLENALKRTSHKGVTERLYSGSRRNSPSLSASSKRSSSLPNKGGLNSPAHRYDKNASRNYSRSPSVNSDSGYGRNIFKQTPNAGSFSRTPQKYSSPGPGASLNRNSSQKTTPAKQIANTKAAYSNPNRRDSPGAKTMNTSSANTKIREPIKSAALTRNQQQPMNNSNKFGRGSPNTSAKNFSPSSRGGNVPNRTAKNATTNIPNTRTNNYVNNYNNLKENLKQNNHQGGPQKGLAKNESDDDSRLQRKLEDLRKKNKEYDSKPQELIVTSYKPKPQVSDNSLDVNDIDERLNKLQNLLKMAKN